MAEIEQASERTSFIPYVAAMRMLAERLQATPEELAAWIWFGPEQGGLAAYTNANELADPPRFYYSYDSHDSHDSHDYVAPLMGCWFRYDDLMGFVPQERFMTGKQLLERWSTVPGLRAESYIRAKIEESMLLDVRPITGSTQWTEDGAPPLETALFLTSHVKNIEREEGIIGPNRADQTQATLESQPEAMLDELEVEQLPEPSKPAGGRRDHQLDAIVSTAAQLGYDPLRIRRGGKAEIRKKLVMSKPGLFTKSAFEHAWKKARKQGLVEVDNVDQYRKRPK